MADQKNRKRIVHYLPVYGTASTGLIYTAIGVIAILSLLQIKQGGADEGSLMQFLNDYLWGTIIICIILLGMVSYVAWRVFEAIKDPYAYGKGWKGIGRRAGIALSSIADAFIAFAAIQVLLGFGNIQEDGRPTEKRQMVNEVLQENWGDFAIIALGAILSVTAVVQFIYGVTRGYRERQDIARFNKEKKQLIHFFAYLGYSARGIIVGIIGFFFIKAGVLEEANHVVNTDKAFNFLGDHVGYLPFVLVAIGTICYGMFMFSLAITYDVDNDPSKGPKNKEHQ